MKYEVDDFEVYIDPRLNFEGDEIIIDLENFFFFMLIIINPLHNTDNDR